jgi:osmotically-inducible protein OsmY
MIAKLRDPRFKETLLAFAMAVGLAGCVVVISDDGIEAGTEAHWDGASRGDAELAVRVRDALKADPLLAKTELKVRAEHGVVTLRGEVEGTERFDRAVQLAKGVEGVEKVVSRLKVEIK